MKQILMLNYEFPPLGGGAGNAAYYVLRELAKRDDLEITLVTSSPDEYREEKFSGNIKVYRLDIGKQGNVHYQSLRDLIVYSVKAYGFCEKLIAGNKFDLIHAWFGIPCGYIAMKLDLPYIVSLRGSDVPFYNPRFYWLDKFVFRGLSRKIWKNARAVIANSEDLKGLALKTSPDADIEVIPNGVDTRQFTPGEKETEDFVILSTSRLIERKGIKYLVQAFCELSKKYPKVKLILAGDGDQKKDLQEYVRNEGVADKVEFAGVVPHEDMPGLYRRADVFVLPSLNEGMSNSLLEAMASGLAVVTTDTGGASGFLGEAGIFVEKASSESILDALRGSYEDREKLSHMKRMSRKIAEEFSWRRVAERTLALYAAR
ncbi:MAG: glycosyltransferase family 4 protein [Candidatus Omnitrophota bacterium]